MCGGWWWRRREEEMEVEVEVMLVVVVVVRRRGEDCWRCMVREHREARCSAVIVEDVILRAMTAVREVDVGSACATRWRGMDHGRV